MLSVAIPARDHERALVQTLAALVPGVADGVVRDVVVADLGSKDATLEVADFAGCNSVRAAGSRSDAMNAAAGEARGPWLLFLEPGVTLEEGWHREVRSVVEALETAGQAERRAVVFRLAFDGFDGGARLDERVAGLAAALTGLPRPEQGLLIRKSLFERLGGFRGLPAMAEADLVRRIGRSRIVRLRTRAVAPRPRRSWRNGPRWALRSGLLMLRVPPRFVARLYG